MSCALYAPRLGTALDGLHGQLLYNVFTRLVRRSGPALHGGYMDRARAVEPWMRSIAESIAWIIAPDERGGHAHAQDEGSAMAQRILTMLATADAQRLPPAVFPTSLATHGMQEPHTLRPRARLDKYMPPVLSEDEVPSLDTEPTSAIQSPSTDRMVLDCFPQEDSSALDACADSSWTLSSLHGDVSPCVPPKQRSSSELSSPPAA
ncbi:hypothetical protein MVES1_001808 [Malassezia vespertilionis]|nr:uncharacterized protein MVES1_001808 [Malassezia vespertilionis]WFD06463.1 hypothetical protein MVES1_001808 [Malassezia vespertilionis]